MIKNDNKELLSSHYQIIKSPNHQIGIAIFVVAKVHFFVIY